MSPEDRRAREIADHMLSQEGTGPAWGIEIEEAGLGHARVAMVVRDDMANGHGLAHGGMIFALADTAFAYACNSRGTVNVAASATIHFLAPARVGDRLVAEASEEARVGRSGSSRVVVRNQHGETIATFSGLSRDLQRPIFKEE